MTFDCAQCLLENKDNCGQVDHIGCVCEECIAGWDIEENERLHQMALDPILGPLIEQEFPLVSPLPKSVN